MKHLLFFVAALLFTFSGFSQSTYKVGNTEYYTGKYYSTTGKPMVKRSYSNVRDFLQSRGLSSIPSGYQVDHIVPLSQGGSDDPSNMQLLTIVQHKSKTARERSSSAYNIYTPVTTYTLPNVSLPCTTFDTPFPSYSLPEISLPTYSFPSYTLPSISSGSSKTILTGPRGGKYYINSNGNKTYVR